MVHGPSHMFNVHRFAMTPRYQIGPEQGARQFLSLPIHSPAKQGIVYTSDANQAALPHSTLDE